MNRAAAVGQDKMRALIDGFGFNMPPLNSAGEGTPPSTAAVLGLISGSPRRVHQMSGVMLNALIEKGNRAVKPPSLIRTYDYTDREVALAAGAQPRLRDRAEHHDPPRRAWAAQGPVASAALLFSQ